MAAGNMNSADMLRSAVWAAAGMVLAWVGVNTAETMEDLTKEVGLLGRAIVKLESRVDGLPPKEMMLRIQLAEEEQKRLQLQIDRVEHRLLELEK